MLRRSSDYLRGRQSLLIVNETRGVPLKIISLLIGCYFFLRSGQILFVCDLSEESPIYTSLLSVWAECKSNPYQLAVSRLVAFLFFLLGCLRLQVALTEHVADLYNALLYLVASNYYSFFTIVHVKRSGGDVPPFAFVPILAGVLYESYILYLVRARLVWPVSKW